MLLASLGLLAPLAGRLVVADALRELGTLLQSGKLLGVLSDTRTGRVRGDGEVADIVILDPAPGCRRALTHMSELP